MLKEYGEYKGYELFLDTPNFIINWQNLRDNTMLIQSKTKVDKLTQRVENLYDQKERKEREDERLQARLKQIKEAPKFAKTDFWCHKHGDSTGIAVKVVFGPQDDISAYYESIGNNICREDMACCKGLRRRITDKNSDPYFRESAMVIKQAREAQAKGWLLQPGDWAFDIKYPELRRKKNAHLEKEARANWTKKIMV